MWFVCITMDIIMKYRLTKYEYCTGKVLYSITSICPFSVVVQGEDGVEIMEIWERLKKFGGESKETILEQIQ